MPVFGRFANLKTKTAPKYYINHNKTYKSVTQHPRGKVNTVQYKSHILTTEPRPGGKKNRMELDGNGTKMLTVDWYRIQYNQFADTTSHTEKNMLQGRTRF